MKIKFITLNLFKGGLYYENIKAFLTKENPDILCLQEAYNSKDKTLTKNYRSIDNLKELLPNHYYHFSPELLENSKNKKTDIGNAIFSRFPIIHAQTTFYDIQYGKYDEYLKNDNKYDFSLQPKNLEYANIQTHGISLNVFNTHGIWEKHGNDTKRRLQMGEIIINQIKDKKNVILAGDFNLFPNTQTVKNIEKYLKSVFSNELKTTFNLRLKPHPGNYGNSVVDMIFVSKEVKIIEKYCPNIDVSDHFPLVSVFEIKAD